jgi:secreted PhoX family phosphatase
VENHNFQVFQIIKNDGTKWAVDTIAMSNNQRVIANQPGNLNRSTAIHQLYPNAW